MPFPEAVWGSHGNATIASYLRAQRNFRGWTPGRATTAKPKYACKLHAPREYMSRRTQLQHSTPAGKPNALRKHGMLGTSTPFSAIAGASSPAVPSV
jgi:hypothetical protein